jgi:hypothetical protein
MSETLSEFIQRLKVAQGVAEQPQASSNPVLALIVAGIKEKPKVELTQGRLRKRLHYDPNSGIFTWLVRPSKNGFVGPGDVAGQIYYKNVAGHKYGPYISIQVDDRPYEAHRLIWLYMYGRWPEELDHCDRDGTNNRLNNLIEVKGTRGRSIQLYNVGLRRNNKSGYTGINWDSGRRKWGEQ